MDEYSGERPASRGGRTLGAASPEGSTASQWESSEHIQTNINHLSATLAGTSSPATHFTAQSVPERYHPVHTGNV